MRLLTCLALLPLSFLCIGSEAWAQSASASVRANSPTWIIDSQNGVGVSAVAQADTFNPATGESVHARSESSNGVGVAHAKAEARVRNTSVAGYLFANAGTYAGTITPLPTAASFLAEDLQVVGSALGT